MARIGRPKGTFNQQPPKYRLHRRSGNAIVTLNGRDVYLGKWGETRADAPESWQKYDQLIGEWLLRGRQSIAPGGGVTVEQVIAGYLEHYQQERGTLPTGYDVQALRWLRRMYAGTPADKFSPVCLKAIRMKMAQTKCANFGVERSHTLSRRYINHMTFTIKRVFAWAAEVEMVPASVHYGLHAVKPLKRGQAAAHENARVLPVDQCDIDAVLEVASPTIAAMIRVQLHTGARCGEVFQMRGCDIDMSDPRCWKYQPARHKTQHHGKARVILLGPQAQEVIRPFLTTNVTKYLFSPAESYRCRMSVRRASAFEQFCEDVRTRLAANPDARIHRCYNEARIAARTAGASSSIPAIRTVYRELRKKRSPSVIRRNYSLSKPSPFKAGDKFSVPVYCDAIQRAVARADLLAHQRRPDVPADVAIVKRWHSHQLRHTFATNVRRQYGLDVAQALLGHSSASMTEVYAELDYSAAEAAIGKVG